MSKAYEEGYNQGMNHGMQGERPEPNSVQPTDEKQEEFNAGYAAGYKDAETKK